MEQTIPTQTTDRAYFLTADGQAHLRQRFAHIASFDSVSTCAPYQEDNSLLIYLTVQEEAGSKNHPHELLYLAAQAQLELDFPHIHFVVHRHAIINRKGSHRLRPVADVIQEKMERLGLDAEEMLREWQKP